MARQGVNMVIATRRMLHMKGEINSTRIITDEGYLLVDATISAEGVYPFRSSELDGPDGNQQIESVYISPDILFNEKTIADISILPTTMGHPEPDVKPENYNLLATGHVMAGTVGKVGPGNGLGAKLLITDPEAIRTVQSHEAEEISLGFYADVTQSSGAFEGEQYTKKFVLPLNCNHIAVVTKGRAGPQVRIHNAMPEGIMDRRPLIEAMKSRMRRREMVELTSADLEDIVWRDPQREVAAENLAEQQAEIKTVREMGDKPTGAEQSRQWKQMKDENKELYHGEIRRQISRATELDKFRNLSSLALTTGLTGVLGNQIWDHAQNIIQGGGGAGQPRIDNAKGLTPSLTALAKGMSRSSTLDADRRVGTFFSRLWGDPDVNKELYQKAQRVTARVFDDLPGYGGSPAELARNPRMRASLELADEMTDSGELIQYIPEAEDILHSQRGQAKLEFTKQIYDEMLINTKQFVKRQTAAVSSVWAVSGGGVLLLPILYDEIKARFLAGNDAPLTEAEVKQAIAPAPTPTVEVDDGRTDMASSREERKAQQLIQTRDRMREKLLARGSKKPMGYKRGFGHGVFGGALAGGLLGFGLGKGISAAGGAVSSLLGRDEEPMQPSDAEYYGYGYNSR